MKQSGNRCNRHEKNAAARMIVDQIIFLLFVAVGVFVGSFIAQWLLLLLGK